MLLRNGQLVDRVDSYFGLREVTIHGAAILINGKAVFQRLVLDQGFYRDGIWTAPTDEALRNDIKLSQAVGFNGAGCTRRFSSRGFSTGPTRWDTWSGANSPTGACDYRESGHRSAGNQRMDGNPPPRSQPSGDHRLVPLQRDIQPWRGRCKRWS